MPATPPIIFAPAPAGKSVLLITLVSTSGINGRVIYCGLMGGRAAWSTDGTQVAGAGNTIVEYISGTTWKVARGSSYAALLVSAAATPDGLSSWGVPIGAGSPILLAAGVSVPPVITP